MDSSSQTNQSPTNGSEKVLDAEDAQHFISRKAQEFYAKHGNDTTKVKEFLADSAGWAWAFNEWAGRYSSYAFPTGMHYFSHLVFWLHQDHLRSHPVGQA